MNNIKTKNRICIVMMVLFLVLGLMLVAGCSKKSKDSDSSASLTQYSGYFKTEKEFVSYFNDNCLNKSAADVYNDLSAKGYAVVYNYKNTEEDATSEILEFSQQQEYQGDNAFVVTVLKSKDLNANKIICEVDSKANLIANEQASANEEALEKKLPKKDAVQAMEDYGKVKYPYGFKLHSIVGRISQEAIDANTWEMKIKCDVTNQYGSTEKDRLCHAKITGDSANP